MRSIALFLFGLLVWTPLSAQTLVPSKLVVAKEFQSLFTTEHTVWLPPGFRMNVFAAGKISGPRFMQFDPQGDLCVALTDFSTVVMLPDQNHDGVADSVVLLAEGTKSAHSIALHDGALYVANPGQVLRYSNPNSSGKFTTSTIFIDNIPHTIQENGPNHTSRTILFDDSRKKIFLSVGAPCNACRETDTDRAAIWMLDQDGTHKKIYASGLRNAVGLAMDSDHTLWATIAERNTQGADLPGELITHIEPDGFYGWPLAYGDHSFEDFAATPEYTALLPLSASDSQKVEAMRVPDVTIAAHSTPLGFAYHDASKLPSMYDKSFFVASHGSYQGIDGRLVANGSKIILVHRKDNVWVAEDFAIGFLTDSIAYKRWARPAGIILDNAGNIFFTSDHADSTNVQAVYRIAYDPSFGVEQQPELAITISVSNGMLRILGGDIQSYEILDLLGRTFKRSDPRAIPAQSIDIRELPSGIYFAIIRTGGRQTVVRKFLR